MTESTEVYNFTVATGHDAKLKPQVENGLTHDWSIYVKGAQGTRLDLVVNEVEFKLHESFPDPIRTIRSADSSGAYRVGESGYAGFIVHIKVKFMNGFTIDLKHDLFLYNSRDVSSTTEHSLTFANPTGKFRDSLIQSGAEVKDKSPQRSPPLLSAMKSDSKYDKQKEKVRRPDPERPRSKEDRKSIADKTSDRDNARKDEKRARKEEKRKRREKEDREKPKKVQKTESKSKVEIDYLFDSEVKTHTKPRSRPEDKKSDKSEKRDKSKSGRSLEEKQKSLDEKEKKKKNRDKDREKDRSDRDKERDKNREKKKIKEETKSSLSKNSFSTGDLPKKIKIEPEEKKIEKRKPDDEKQRQREKRKSEKMKPEPRVEPDPKRTKLAEPKKEPKIEPHDPADEAPRLDREHRDDKALEAEKRRKREKEERREKKREERRKEKNSKHEDKPRGDRPPIKLKIQKENIKIEPDPKREKKPKIKDPAGSSSSSSRRESDIPKREIEKAEIKQEYPSSDSIKVEKTDKKQSRSSKRPLPIPGKDLPKDQPISSQSSPATTAESPAFHTRSPSLAPSIPPSGPDFTPSQPPSSMPSPIGSTENWNTDDDRMSTGHSVHTGSRSENETRQKTSDRVKGPEEEETPKISDSDSGSHTTDDDHSSSDSSDSNASSDDSDSDSDDGKCEEISQDELQEIQQKIMQYLKSTDSKYDKVLANIFNYIFEKEENKLNLDESTCKFDLTSLQARTQSKIKNFLSNISS